jgi:hypothetical protein
MVVILGGINAAFEGAIMVRMPATPTAAGTDLNNHSAHF